MNHKLWVALSLMNIWICKSSKTSQFLEHNEQSFECNPPQYFREITVF